MIQMHFTQALLLIMIICSLNSANGQQVKLMIPGEHLGYKLEYYNESGELISTPFVPNELWNAVYSTKDSFQLKEEILTWDTTRNLTIESKNVDAQPIFYFQGLNDVLYSGSGCYFDKVSMYTTDPLIWELKDRKFTILYGDNPNISNLSKYEYGIINLENQIHIFEGEFSKDISEIKLDEANTVKLHWTGDLNGDNEPDFFIQLKSHHEVPTYELIISKKTEGKVEWVRIVRFTEWS